MKKFITFLCLMLALFCSIKFVGHSAFAEMDVCVRGEAERSFIPDVAVVTVGVESIGENLVLLQQENSENVNKVLSELKNSGISDENIKTKNFNVFQRYDYSNGEKLLGYQISNQIEFKTDNISGLGSLIDSLMSAGANRFSGLSFTLSNYKEAYSEVLKEAVENAKAKAAHICAQELTISCIQEESSSDYIYSDFYACTKAELNTIMKGDIKIKASVKVKFEG